MGSIGSRVRVRLLRREEIPFLVSLWNAREVMRYADEFPGLRGWSRKWDPGEAWLVYRRRRARLGPEYSQLILLAADGKPMGEAFFAPLPEEYVFGAWRKPTNMRTVIGDVKLLRQFWGAGMGTEAMRKVARWVFLRTPCDLFIVPPHRRNPAAQRVYEKAGFVLHPATESAKRHRVMELSRSGFERQLRGARRAAPSAGGGRRRDLP